METETTYSDDSDFFGHSVIFENTDSLGLKIMMMEQLFLHFFDYSVELHDVWVLR